MLTTRAWCSPSTGLFKKSQHKERFSYYYFWLSFHKNDNSICHLLKCSIWPAFTWMRMWTKNPWMTQIRYWILLIEHYTMPQTMRHRFTWYAKSVNSLPWGKNGEKWFQKPGEIGKVVDNSWQTTIDLLKIFISRLIDNGERRRASALQPFFHFYHHHMKNYFFFTLLHLLVYATLGTSLDSTVHCRSPCTFLTSLLCPDRKWITLYSAAVRMRSVIVSMRTKQN